MIAISFSLRLCFVLLAVASLSRAQPSHKLALVIGMSGYDDRVGRLPKVENDAKSVGAALGKIGFQVTQVLDFSHSEWMSEVTKFTSTITSSDVVLVYYAGHGAQVNGTNYLLPSDFSGLVADLPKQGVALDDLIQRVAARSPKLNIFVIDACRNNPFDKNLKQGLANLSAVAYASGTYIAMAASPGEVATDGLFARHFVAALGKRGIEVRQLFTEVRSGVEKESGQREHPVSTHLISESYILAPANLGMVMTNMTVSAAFQPAGLSGMQITIGVTPNAGNTYTATLRSNSAPDVVVATLVNGVATDDGKTLTFESLQRSENVPMSAFYSSGGVMYTLSAATLTMTLTPSGSGEGAGQASGSMRGFLNFSGRPITMGGRGFTPDPKTGDVTASGQVLGTYSQTLVADTGQPLSAPVPQPTGVATFRTSPLPRVGVDGSKPFTMPKIKCAEACTAKIGDFKRVARYSHPHPQYPTLTCDEKVFQLPEDWPGGPFLHTVVCKGPNARGTTITIVNIRLARSAREHDEDTTILFTGAAGLGTIGAHQDQPGRPPSGPWNVKVFGDQDVESMSIEVSLRG
jgi:hypothetical protein